MIGSIPLFACALLFAQTDARKHHRSRVVPGSHMKANAENKCNYAVELMIAQDDSRSFDPYIEALADTTHKLIEEMTATYKNFKFGFSTFVDKPLPGRAYGVYGNWYERNDPDWCYKLEVPLGTDADRLQQAMNDAAFYYGGGQDQKENPLEGLIYAAVDPQIGWTDPSVTWVADDQPVVRLALVVTDNAPHKVGDAQTAVDHWNSPRVFPEDGSMSYGGFASEALIGEGQIWLGDLDEKKPEYMRLVNMYKKVDQEGLKSLTAEEKEDFDFLNEKYGPTHYEDVVAHPGDMSRDCITTEYPSPKTVAKTLKRQKINPIFLLATNDEPCDVNSDTPWGECLVKFYENLVDEMDVYSAVTTITTDNLYEQIVATVNGLTAYLCEVTPPPSPPPHSSSSTSTSTTEKSDDCTGDDCQGEDTTAKPTPKPTEDTDEDTTTAPGSDDDTTTAPGGDDDETTTALGSDDTTTDTTTEGAGGAIPPVIPPVSGGTSTGVIAGAAGGAAAGAAALAGLLYAKGGMAMFGGGGSGAVAAMEQVDVPESPVERETMEEVTMDMFQ